MHRKVILAAALLCIASPLYAQSAISTSPFPILITAGNTYQQLLPVGKGRRSLTIENNNATDSCWVTIGGPNAVGNTVATSLTINGVTLTAKQASILLLPGGSIGRYSPYLPSDLILVTCTTTGDSVYVEIQ